MGNEPAMSRNRKPLPAVSGKGFPIGDKERVPNAGQYELSPFAGRWKFKY
jgi:hypothetical protein